MIQGFDHIEVKINVSVHIMKGCGVEVQLHAFLPLAPDGGEYSTLHPGHFSPGERASTLH
jgi:hypothetical protein